MLGDWTQAFGHVLGCELSEGKRAGRIDVKDDLDGNKRVDNVLVGERSQTGRYYCASWLMVPLAVPASELFKIVHSQNALIESNVHFFRDHHGKLSKL